MLSAASSTSASNNVLIRNQESGIVVISSNCEFLFNDLMENGGLQATDSGTENQFSNSFWLDWQAEDQNEDGYLDTPKPLAGSAENEDALPRASPNNE